MREEVRLLIVEDSPSDAEMAVRQLRNAGFEPQWRRVETAAEYLAALQDPPDLIISDYSLPHFDGIRAMDLLRERGLDVPLLLVSGTLGEDAAVAAMSHGAADYLLKDRLVRLPIAVRRALEEKALRDRSKRAENHAQLQLAALESAANGIVITDREGIILSANSAFCTMTGYAAEEVLGKNPRFLQSGKVDRKFYENLWKTILSGQVWFGEMTNRRKDGKLYVEEMTITPIRGGDGRITHFIAIKQDLTERKQAEQAARDAAQRYQLLFTGNPQPMWIFDKCNLYFLEVNDAAIASYGYSRDEFLSMTIREIRLPEDLPALLADLEGREKRGFGSGPWRHRKKDGTLIDVEVFSHDIDFSGRRARFVLATDITERERAQEAERLASAKYENLFNSVPVGLFKTTLTGELLLANPALLCGMGYASLEEMKQHAPTVDLLYRDSGQRDELIRLLKEKGGVQDFQAQFQGRDNQVRWVSMNARGVRDSNDELKGIEGSIVDITERKLAEEQLEERARLARLEVDVNQALTRSDTLREIMQLCAEALVHHLDAAFARIWTLNEESVLELQASAGMYTHLDGAHSRVPVGKFKIGRIAQDRKPVLTNDVLNDPRIHDHEWAKREGMVSFAGYPLLAGDRLIGVLAVFARKPLTEATLESMASVSYVISLGASRKQAERSLRESEERYRVLFNANPMPMWVFDIDTLEFLAVNDTAVRHYGYSKEEFLCMKVTDIRQENPEGSFLGKTLPAVTRLGLRQHRIKDGTTIQVEVTASDWTLAGRRARIVLINDVTEKNRVEAEIRLLQNVTLATSEAADLESALNAVLEEIGRTSPWIAGAAWLPQPQTANLKCACSWFREPADRPRFNALFESTVSASDGILGRAWSNMETQWIPDLSTEVDCPRSVAVSALEIHTALTVPIIANDKPIAVFEFFADQVLANDERFVDLTVSASVQVAGILGRRTAEKALRASEARFARLADSGIIGITIGDTAGNVLEANDAYLNMVGFSREDFARGAVRWIDLIPPEFKNAVDMAEAQLRQHGVAYPFEMETFRKDGSRLPVLIGVALLEDSTAIVFMADLTERKKAEAALLTSESQLRQAQKMEAVGRLAGGVAHDFNNLLSVILGYGEIMLANLKPGDPMREEVGEVCAAGKRAADLTRQLLLFSRQQVLTPKVIDLNGLVSGMDKMLNRILGEDVDLVSLLSPSLGRIKADPGSVEQVILNLVVNARDAMPTGGKLTIETANGVLGENHALGHQPVKPGPYVMLAVSDTGTGMDRETQARIFEPFFTTKEQGKGTGLGLSTVFGIVQQSGGHIWVYSEPGKGSTFKIYLPSVDSKIDVPGTQASPAALRGKETILLVEDEKQVREVVLAVLRHQGYNVIPTQNAGEALLFCEKHPKPIDLLLTDVVMPQMSGPELAKRLASTKPGMKVLCMSGYTDDSIVRHGVLEGNVAFLQKPITPDSLGRKVRAVLDENPRPTKTG